MNLVYRWSRRAVLALPILLPLLAGCPSGEIADAVGPRIADVDAIASSADLSPTEKRQRLAEMGLDPLTINAALSGERTANQFGGDLRTAFNKVTGGQLSELTPDEIQIYTDAAQTEGGFSFNITDPQAAAVQRFLRLNALDTTAEVEGFLNDPASDVPIDIPENFLQTVFVDFDPELLIPVLP